MPRNEHLIISIEDCDREGFGSFRSSVDGHFDCPECPLSKCHLFENSFGKEAVADIDPALAPSEKAIQIAVGRRKLKGTKI